MVGFIFWYHLLLLINIKNRPKYYELKLLFELEFSRFHGDECKVRASN